MSRLSHHNFLTVLMTTGCLFTAGLILPTAPARALCPQADLTGDCTVDLADFAVMADQWLDTGIAEPAGMEWVAIDDPGVSGHEAFNGEISRYEVTNGQYCEYLNAAMNDGLITVYDGNVYDISDTTHQAPYLATYPDQTNSQINYSGGVFTPRTRDTYDMSNHPVCYVSWFGATAFCDYYGFRLPTEWEWQAVADFDGSFTYGCGPTVGPSEANYNPGGTPNNPLGLSSIPYTSPVGYYGLFGYGLADTAAGIDEWTDTCHDPGCTPSDDRVIRGGSWAENEDAARTDARVGYPIDARTMDVGFRPCR